MSDRLEISSERLHALIDGELSPSESAELEAVIAADAVLSRRLGLFRADKARLAQVYGPIIDAPIPPQWLTMIHSPPARQPRRMFSVEAVAGIAAALMVFVGGTLVYRQNLAREEPIVEEALASRDDLLPARQSMAVTEAQASTVSRTLSKTLAMHLSAPDLRRMGYSLAGMKVYGNVPGGKGVELIYRKPDRQVFALYVRHSSGAPRFDQYKQGKLRVCIWQDDVLGAVMTGEMSAAEMQRLASLTYMGLES